jgi:hypothetical protein
VRQVPRTEEGTGNLPIIPFCGPLLTNGNWILKLFYNESMDQRSSGWWRADATLLTISKSLLVLGGLASFCLSAWGVLASLILDYRTSEILLILCFVFPFPAFLSFLRSPRLSAFLLWALFIGQWFMRQFVLRLTTQRSNPPLNPLDEIGRVYFGIAVAVQVAYLLKARAEASITLPNS